MTESSPSRRDFLHGLSGAGALLGLSRIAPAFGQEPAQGAPAQAPSGQDEPAIEHRRFGKTDMRVALLGFGGAEIGYEGVEQAGVDKLLGAALDAGLNVLDTAECYADSEEKIGAAVGHRRKDYYLFTKCGHATPEGVPGGDWGRAAITASLERSLKRLRTDAVDLLQLHSCSLEELQKGECIEALEALKKAGKTRYVGYSGDSRTALFAIESGRFDALQTSISIADQECLELTLPLARKKEMGVIAKRPIANAAWRYDELPENGYHQEYWRRLQALAYDFATGAARARQDADGAAGVALRFTAMQPGVHVLIVGTTKPERWKQNAELLRAGPLPQELEASIRERWKAVATKEWIGQT
jgi:aryl-alcohol dehydrogenase-like predicted oxidoreductase